MLQATPERGTMDAAREVNGRTDVQPEKPELPAWFRRYLIERRRALLAELREVEKLLNIQPLNTSSK